MTGKRFTMIIHDDEFYWRILEKIQKNSRNKELIQAWYKNDAKYTRISRILFQEPLVQNEKGFGWSKTSLTDIFLLVCSWTSTNSFYTPVLFTKSRWSLNAEGWEDSWSNGERGERRLRDTSVGDTSLTWWIRGIVSFPSFSSKWLSVVRWTWCLWSMWFRTFITFLSSSRLIDIPWGNYQLNINRE